MEDLTDAYENGKYIEGAADFPPRWDASAKAFRDRLIDEDRAELDIPYGPNERHRFDLFHPNIAPVGLAVFVHGGYWKAFDKSTWSHLAAGALEHGFTVAMPSYVLAPKARISQITQDVHLAIDAAAQRVAGPIHLAGHSAGGHLVSRMLCRDLKWDACFHERIARVVSISGLHDLRPLMQTAMNGILGLDPTEAAAESAVLHKDNIPVPITAWVGGAERPAFLDQSRWLADAWHNAKLVIESDRHHFDVIEALEQAQSPLTRAFVG